VRIHKGILVRRTKGFDPSAEPWFLKPGIVLSGAYEEHIQITDYPLPVTNVILVCDLMIDGQVYQKIPIEHLEKIRSPAS
jgi:hypothetical protein